MAYRGRRVTVMGLGHFGGGAAAARWLARQGALVTVTDLAGEAVLADALTALAGEPIAAYHLGGHRPEDFSQAEIVVVNPAVRPDNRLLALARSGGAELTSEIELFLNACRGQVLGVTGSNGKSTTAAMTADVLRAAGRRVWFGGNVGRSLLDETPQIEAADWVVLELSSFQLHHLSATARMPRVAIVTNCTPNHLNWHPDFGHYVAAKQRLLRGLPADGLAVLNTSDREVSSWSGVTSGRVLPLLADSRIPPLSVPGEHNRQNARLAATAARGMGVTDEAIRAGLAGFRGLPQRLEWLTVYRGRTFYNDSTATTPESTIAALRSLEGGLWLLAGGADKGVDYGELAAAIATRVRGAAFFGQIGPRLYEAVARCRPGLLGTVTDRLEEALAWCWPRSRPGETILFSPGCASLDQFTNFRQRGEHFVDLVRRLRR